MSRLFRWTKEMGWGAAVTLLYALCSSLQLYAYYHIVEKRPFRFLRLFPSEFLYSALWVIFFFIVRATMRMLPAGGGRRTFRLAVHGVMALVVPPLHLLIYFWLNVVLEPLKLVYVPEPQLLDAAFFDQLFINYLLYAVILGVVLFFDSLKKSRDFELAHMQSELQQTRLKNLQTRLQPEYIFPAFEKLEELICSQPERAFGLMSRLSLWLRRIQDLSARSLVPLEDEVRLVEAMIELDGSLSGKEITLRLNIGHEALAWPVPPLLLQTLLAQVLQDSAALRDKGAGIALTADAADERLVIKIWISGWKSGGARPAELAGEPFAPLRAQMAVLYGENGSLSLAPGPAEETVIEMRLPWIERRPGAEAR